MSPPRALYVTLTVHTFIFSSLEFSQISLIKVPRFLNIYPVGVPPQFVHLAKSFPVPKGRTQHGILLMSTPASIAAVTAPIKEPSPPAITSLTR